MIQASVAASVPAIPAEILWDIITAIPSENAEMSTVTLPKRVGAALRQFASQHDVDPSEVAQAIVCRFCEGLRD